MKRLEGQKRLDRIEALAARDGLECHYCHVRLTATGQATTIDELVPLVRGGTTDIDNQVLACLRCNNDKADRTHEEVMIGAITGRVPPSYQRWRVELKRRQRETQFVNAGVPSPRARRQARLKTSLADAWPCTHSHPAAFCDVCAGP